MRIKPVLKWPGGKSREIARFKKYIPNDYKRYVEPFLGGGAVYFYLEPKDAILNDKSARLMAFYKQLRDNYPELKKKLTELDTLYEQNREKLEELKRENPGVRVYDANEVLYYKMRNIINQQEDQMNTVNYAVAFYLVNKTAFSGAVRHNRSGGFNTPFGRYKHINARLVTAEHSELLQHAELYCTDYETIFDMVSNDDFVFLDPPYDTQFHNYGRKDSEDDFDEDCHRRLASDFKNLPCKALMVVGKTPLMEVLYSGYICDEYYKRYAINMKNRFVSEKVHAIIKNY